MSSIMRCRSGLMASSVMGDAPVLMKVANPSSQDRTPHRAIPLAVSPEAGPYRASGLVQWRKAAIRQTADVTLVPIVLQHSFWIDTQVSFASRADTHVPCK